MKWFLTITLIIAILIVLPVIAQKTEMNTQEDSMQNDNPFYSDYDTPFGVPPFEQIKEEHYLPAFTQASPKRAKK